MGMEPIDLPTLLQKSANAGAASALEMVILSLHHQGIDKTLDDLKAMVGTPIMKWDGVVFEGMLKQVGRERDQAKDAIIGMTGFFDKMNDAFIPDHIKEKKKPKSNELLPKVNEDFMKYLADNGIDLDKPKDEKKE